MAKVLVVDDFRQDVESLIRELEYLGHSVSYASCGVDAQRAMLRGEVDCACYDGFMPNYAGAGISSVPEGVFLARETRRKRPEMKCVLYSRGLDTAYIAQLESMKVPFFDKEKSNIIDILDALGL